MSIKTGRETEILVFNIIRGWMKENVSQKVSYWLTEPFSKEDLEGKDIIFQVGGKELYIQVKTSWKSMEARHIRQYASNNIWIDCQDFDDRRNRDEFIDFATLFGHREWAKTKLVIPSRRMEPIVAFLKECNIRVPELKKAETLLSLMNDIHRLRNR